MLKKGMVATGILVVTLLAAAAVWMLINREDIPPPDDRDLILERTEIPPQDNGYTDLVAAAEALNLAEADVQRFWQLANGTEWDGELAERLLQENTNALSRLEEALESPTFQSDDTVSTLSGLRRLAGLVSIRADAALRAGDAPSTIDGIIKVLRLGESVERSGASVSYLVGVSLKESGCALIQRLLPELRLGPNQTRKLLETLSKHSQTTEENLANALRREYTQWLTLMEETAGREEDGWTEVLGLDDFLFKPNETRRLHASSYRRLIAHASKPCDPTLELETTDRSFHRLGMVRDLIVANQVGRALHDIGMPSIAKILESKCHAKTRSAVTQLLLALKSYRFERGALPETLDALLPAYFETLPVSDHDGQAFRYSATERALGDSKEVFDIALTPDIALPPAR